MRKRFTSTFAKVLLAVGIGGALLASFGYSDAASRADKPIRIGLVYLGPHELINQIVSGFKQGVAETADGAPYVVVERHASSDKTQVSATVNAAISANLNVIATITTPVSQAALKNAPQTLPVVFVGVTDPVGAGLVRSLEKPVLSTGVSDLAPLAAMLETIRTLAPHVKTIGFPYSPDEQPAVFSRQLLERLAPSKGFKVDARPVPGRDDLGPIVRELVRANDAIAVGADNAMFEASPVIAKIALDNRKPFFAADSTCVKEGAVAGVTIDYRKVGLAGGRLAVRVARGEAAGTIPVALMTEGALELNRRSLNALGMRPSEAVWRSAVKIYE